MPFTLQSLVGLPLGIQNLEILFSNLLERYQIPLPPEPPSSSSSSVRVLEVLINRTHEHVLKSGTARDSAREVFTKLTAGLMTVLKSGNEKECAQATKFLLGALLHRYFRITKEYGYVSSFFFDIKKCQLFMAIRAALGLPEFYSSEQDLRILDITTIVTSLETFSENMINPDHYKTYPHFAADPNFKKHLEEIFKTYRPLYEPLHKQFRAIAFIRSLKNEIEDEQVSINNILDKWSASLKGNYPDFSKLTLSLIREHLTTQSGPEPIKRKIMTFLASAHIESYFTQPTKTHAQFLEELKSCNNLNAHFVIWGGCVLLLQSMRVDEKVKVLIRMALKEKPTSEDMKNGLILFQNWLIDYRPLDLSFFGGLKELREEVQLSISRVQSDIEAEEKIAACELRI